MKKQTKILFASYECAPFFKMGGLGDVAGSLPKALKNLGVDVRVVIPYYTPVAKKYKLKKFKSVDLKIARRTIKLDIYKSYLTNSRVPIYFLSTTELSVADPFEGEARFRFVLFAKLITELPGILKWQPDIMHANDWQTGMVPLFERTVKSVYTIHNLAYFGRAEFKTLKRFGFKEDDFSSIDKRGSVNIMKEAILSSGAVTTVSPTYAKEILTREYGYSLAPSIKKRKRDLVGIINGLDYHVFNPATDKNIKFKYDINSLDKKIKNKLYLQKLSKLPEDKNIPIIGMVSRLAGQKGFDLLESIIGDLMLQDVQLVILGTGDPHFEQLFRKYNKKYKKKFRAHVTFSIELASQIYAGADMFLMPSKYEPCGLGQLIAMKYGTIPIVRRTGGLADTVKGDTGFSFKAYNSAQMLKTIHKALAVYASEKKWLKLVKNSMKKDFSWNSSAKKYLKMYRKLIK
jgi:starch synthase